jgi:N-acetyl sugar amidotransferase
MEYHYTKVDNIMECQRCLMDDTAKGFYVNTYGYCNFCSDFFAKEHEAFLDSKLISKLKAKKQKYNCIVGLSGGVDSSWALVKAKELGLRPLAVHMDNGWNSELAQNNIQNLVDKLDVDLYTYVIDWEEYLALQKAFFKANVIDIELLYDNAMLATNYQASKKFNTWTILTGENFSTEGILMPENWNWFKHDLPNIKSIAKTFGVKMNSFPGTNIPQLIMSRIFKRPRYIRFLDYFDYNKEAALDELVSKYDYKPYPYKHYESIFTRFYQGYILPNKFNVDKRKIHLSNLVITNQMTRDEAMQKLAEEPYDSKELEKDKAYFLKKFNWTEGDLEDYIAQKEVPHDFYKSNIKYWNIIKYFQSLILKK